MRFTNGSMSLPDRRSTGFRHRKVRHHLEGVIEIRNLFGDQAAEAAMQHIRSDLKEEGWKETDRFPRNTAEYKKMGLF